MRHVNRRPAGFTLVELLMVIALVGILAAMVLPSADPGMNDQLRATARILATDLAYARSLAVTNHSEYRIAFDVKKNQYLLEHSGSNPSLDLLPDSPFSRAGGPQRQMVVALDDLPRVGTRVGLEAVAESEHFARNADEVDFGSLSTVNDVEFGPLGETTRTGWTIIWLGAGTASQKRYTWLAIHPITGLAEVGGSTEYGPSRWLASDGP